MLFKIRVILPLAIIASMVSTFGIYKFLQAKKAELEKPKELTQDVVIATKDFSIGKMLEESDLRLSNWPKEIIPKGSYAETSPLIGRVVRAEIYEGEAILESKLAPVGSDGGFSSVIPPGMRAVTVSVNTYSGVSGFILPNTYVDVFVTVPSPSNKEESSTKIILENVKVLAVDQTFEREGDDPVIVQSVTLLVTPDEAEKLVLASTEGKLQLGLRNTADTSKKQTPGVQLRDLMSQTTTGRRVSRSPGRRTTRRAQPESSPIVVEVIRSNERTEVKFEEGKEKQADEKKKE